MTEPSDEDRVRTKHCQACGEEMNARARKCIKCGSWQSWRGRLFGGGTTILSLWIALISVLISAVPVYRGLRPPSSTNIVVAFQVATEDAISILAANSGGQPGTVRAGVLSIPGLKRNEFYRIPLDVFGGAGLQATIVPANGTVLINLNMLDVVSREDRHMPLLYLEHLDDASLIKAVGQIGQRSGCSLLVKTTNFDGSYSYPTQYIQCSAIEVFLFKQFEEIKLNIQDTPQILSPPPPRLSFGRPLQTKSSAKPKQPRRLHRIE